MTASDFDHANGFLADTREESIYTALLGSNLRFTRPSGPYNPLNAWPFLPAPASIRTKFSPP
jgi:hypothetical protein